MVLLHVIVPTSSTRQILSAWSFDPLVLLVVLVPGLLYWRGLRAWKHSRLRPWQPVAFYSGLFISFLALCSPIHDLGHQLFTMHMLQHLLIQMVVAPLIVAGAPTTPLLLGMPLEFRQKVVRPLCRNGLARLIFRSVTHPVTAYAALVAANWTWHLVPGAYDAAVRRQGIHIAQHLTFYLSSMLFWTTIIDMRPLRSRLAHVWRIPFVFIAILQNVYLGVQLTLSDTLRYTSYATPPRLWGLTPLGDQQAGGALMWVGGDTVLVCTLVVVGILWFRDMAAHDEAEDAKTFKAQRASVNGHAMPGRR
ncbi:MAG: cytochrome c oxidase assembly protein [Chloroflexi bacterium]|nr:cytochrome c oxidase assembly protein [Chloroflexota bacterium]